MPFFSSFAKQNVAKPGVVSDGDVFTTDGYNGHTCSLPSSWTAFHAAPVRSATGVWSVQMKEGVQRVIDVDVKTLLASGTYLSTQLLPTTTASGGQLILNWCFNVAGTPTDIATSSQFLVFVMYSETSAF
jgi:hypothetical protein